MMSTAHSQPVLIRERGEIVRMRRVHDKPNQRAPLFLWTKHASSRQFRETLGCIARKLRIVFENCRTPDPLNVINRSRKADSLFMGAGIRWTDDEIKYLLGSLPRP